MRATALAPTLPLRRLLILLIGVGLSMPAPAQAQSDLQEERQSTQERLETLKSQIQQSESQLEETAEAEKATQERLQQLQRKIALREELVATYQQRLAELEADRGQLRDSLATFERRLDALRQEYRQRAVHAYKYSRINELALILASRSINQMLVRIRYLQRFAQERQEQRQAVQQAATEVRESRQQLEQKREQTQQLLAEARNEREHLEALEADRRQVIQKLRARRSDLKAELKQKRSQVQQLQERIEELVARAEERAASRSKEARAERAAASADLSASFKASRGDLRWPAEGAVTEGYGNRVDPVHGTQTFHPGIEIATQPEARVHSVFDGTVSGVDFVPGFGTYLVVRHGEYLSVYSNFSTLYVSQGESITAGQVLGRAGTENEPRGAAVFFAVFDRASNEPVDPRTWLSAR